MKYRFNLIGFVAAAFVQCFATFLPATDYTINPSQPETGTNYHSLEKLRTTATLQNGDSIILYADDYSLTGSFNLDALTDTQGITIRSNDKNVTRTIGPGPGYAEPSLGGAMKLDNTGTVTLNLDGIGFDGFSVYESVHSNSYRAYGGAIYSSQPLVFNTNGAVTFSNNQAHERSYIGCFGGAIFSGKLTFLDGTYIFTGNSATSMGSVACGNGGAIYSSGGIAFTNGTYIFSDNYSFTDAGNGSHGGAICTSKLEFLDGIYVFTNNHALRTGTFLDSGEGGAIYASNTTFTNGLYTFSDNSAVNGGALKTSSNGNITFKDGTFLFSNNTASKTGGAISATELHIGLDNPLFDPNCYTFNGEIVFSGNSVKGESGNQVGLGGAIAATGHLYISGGTLVFAENSAIGGTGEMSGLGGAIHGSTWWFVLKNGNFTFTENSAIGGSGANSGLGGALFHTGGWYENIIGDVIFQNNRAVRTVSSNVTSGRGGAIFALSDLNLEATAGKTLLFQGNIHGDIDNPTPNGVYFGTYYLGAVMDTRNANFNAIGDILMYDPIESQGSDGVFAAYNVIDLTLNKTGSGLWLLGGESNLNSQTVLSIDEGRFWLYRDAQLNLNHATKANLTFKNGGTFSPTIHGDSSVSTIHTKDITTEPGAKLKVVGVSSLTPGDHIYDDAIVATTSSIDAGFVYKPLPGGTLFTEAKYVANGTAANHDLVITGVKNMKDVLGTAPFLDVYRKRDIIDEERAIFDEIYETGGLDPLKNNPELDDYLDHLGGRGLLDVMQMRRTDAMVFRNLLFERMDCERNRRFPTGNDLWGTLTHTRAELGTSAYTPSAFTFGYDRQSRRWRLGIAGQYVTGNTSVTTAGLTRNDSESLSLGVYAGHCGPRYYVKGSLQFSSGTNDTSFYYNRTSTLSRGSFDNSYFGTSLEIGKTFVIADHERNPWHFSPYFGLDYFFLRSETFNESGTPLARTFNSVQYNVLELPVGVRLLKTFARDGKKWSRIRSTFDMGYACSLADTAPKATAYFSDTPSDKWRVQGTQLGRDAMRTNLSLEGRLLDRFDLGLSWQFESRKRYTAQQLNVAFACQW